MSDYSLKIKVQNARIRRAILATGAKTVAEFCRNSGLNQSDVGQILNMKLPPLKKDGQYKAQVLELADALGVLPDELFSDSQRTMALRRNHATFEISETQVRRLVKQDAKQRVIESALDHPVETDTNGLMVRDLVRVALLDPDIGMTDRERLVLEQTFGLNGRDEKDTIEIAEEQDVSYERIRQIQAHALRKLRMQPKLREVAGIDP